MSNWQKLRALSREEIRFLLKALVLLPIAGVGLRLFGLQGLQRRLESLVDKRGWAKQTSDLALCRAQVTGRMVNIAARYGLFRANCLQRSFVLWWLLLRQGILTSIRIGVDKREGHFHAHAWTEYDGIVLNDHPHVSEQFVAFPPV
jgi:hypothetical protein